MRDNLHGLSRLQSRRTFLALSAMAGVVGLTGCLGGEEEKGSDNGSSSERQFPDLDPADPEWPQPGGRLLDHNLHRGTSDLLEQMKNLGREEPRYGNPVPDPPENDDELLDPETIRFTIGGGEVSRGQFADQTQPLIDAIEKETGRDVEFEQVNDPASKIEAIRSDRIHVANLGAGEVPFGVNIAGADPFAIPVSPIGDGDDFLFGYSLWLITQVDNDEITEATDIEGKNVAHTDRTSNSGNQAPRALFESDLGIVPGEDYEVTFSGGHNNSIRGVAYGDFDAAPVAATSFSRMVDADEADPSNFKILYRATFPSGPNCYHYKLTPDLKNAIQRAHYDYDFTDTRLSERAIDGGLFEPMEYANVFDIILQIHETNGYEYRTGDL
jgi:phosphonate transport system substrate-binding protein